MEYYSEFLNRSSSGTEWFQQWFTKRVLVLFLYKTGLNPGDLVSLEIGSGIGRGGDASKKLGILSYTGVEPNNLLAEFCRSEKNLLIIEEALPTLNSIEDSSFDFVFSIHVLEHAPTYLDAHDWAKEMIRVVKNEGHVLIACPNVLDYKNDFWDCDWSHGYPTTPRRISQLFNDFDVEIVHAGSMHLGSLSWLSAACAHIVKFVFPSRVIDLLTSKFFGRPMATGINLNLLYGLSFVIIKRKDEK